MVLTTIILSINPLVSPDPGLFIWSAVSFLLLIYVLKKIAWKPILKAVNDRESFISESLRKADAAKEEMSRLTNENEALLRQARVERDHILQEARKVKEQIVSEAKDAAHKEGSRIMDQARIEINNQKAIAMTDIKNKVASLSIEIAEKILRKQFEDKQKQDELVTGLLKEVNLN